METPAGFDVTREDVVVGRLRLTVARPRSAEDLIDEDAYAVDERLPYWAELWPSAHVLAEELAARDLAAGGWWSWAAAWACRAWSPPWAAPTSWRPTGTTRRSAFVAPTPTPPAPGRDPAVRLDGTASGLLARPPADLVVGARPALRGAQRPGPRRPGPPDPGPGGEALVADPRRPHADLLLDALVAAGWSLTTEDVRHGAARTRADRSSACTACGAPRARSLRSLQRLSDTLAASDPR